MTKRELIEALDALDVDDAVDVLGPTYKPIQLSYEDDIEKIIIW